MIAARVLGIRDLPVFVSSPDDCQDERNTVAAVVRRLNRDLEAVGHRVRLSTLRWEDLPPGLADPGDFQHRINTLLGHYHLEEFEIYVDLMKGRLGTPTPRHDSGTIEELEASLAGAREKGIPAEVLMYFIEPHASNASDVTQLKGDSPPARGPLRRAGGG